MARKQNNGQGTAVAKSNKDALVALLKQGESRLANLLPKYMTAERVMSLAMLATQKTPKLLECNPHSVVFSIMQAAQLGLEIGRTAHLVPYGDQCNMIPDFKGLIQLAVESGSIRDADPWLVYEGEPFKVFGGTNRRIEHEPVLGGDRSADKVVAAYVIFTLPDGSTRFTWMSRQEIDEVRNASRAKNNGPWVDWYGEMAKKTVIKRGLKTIPSDPTASRRLDMAFEADNRFETGRITMPVPEWDSEESIAAEVSAETLERKAQLKRELEEYAKKNQGGRDVTPQEEPEAEAEEGEDEPDRLTLENELAALMTEKNPDLLKDKKKRAAWISDVLGDDEKTTVKGCTEFELQVLIGALKNGEDEPLPQGTPFDDDEEEAVDQAEMPV